MLVGREFDLNSVQKYADSLKEVLKQTMLRQEVMFRNQVNELHQLYRIQKTLTEDIGWRGVDGFDAYNESSESILIPFTSHVNYKLPGQDRTYSSIPMVSSAQSIYRDLLEEHHDLYNSVQHRSLNLQQTNYYNNQVRLDISKNRYACYSTKDSIEEDISNPDDVKLSLNIKGVTSKKNDSYPQDVIDLEAPIEQTSNEDPNSMPFSREKHELQGSTSSNLLLSQDAKKDVAHVITATCSPVAASGSVEQQNSFDHPGSTGQRIIISQNSFTDKEQVISYESSLMDLNTVQLDESCCHSNNDTEAYPSPATSSDVTHHSKSKHDSSNETHDTVNPASKGSHVGPHASEISPIDLESVSGPTSDQCENEEQGAIDILIQNAAESLIHISLKTPPKVESQRRENVPEYSLDSFESIAVKLTEATGDDFSVSSTAYDVDFIDKKDFNVKLTRGRRMKDFQKDILPGLASLSRHEIREDINIMEGVIRSREYRKFRAKMGDAEKWCSPVKSRRSKLNYLPRKRLSMKFSL